MSIKTVPTDASIEAFLDQRVDPARRSDCARLVELMTMVSGQPARMWGASIIGFGSYHYRYASGHEGSAPSVGFSPRARNLTLYLTGGFEGTEDLLARLGKHKTGKGCLYISCLADVDEGILISLIQHAIRKAKEFDIST